MGDGELGVNFWFGRIGFDSTACFSCGHVLYVKVKNQIKVATLTNCLQTKTSLSGLLESTAIMVHFIMASRGSAENYCTV